MVLFCYSLLFCENEAHYCCSSEMNETRLICHRANRVFLTVTGFDLKSWSTVSGGGKFPAYSTPSAFTLYQNRVWVRVSEMPDVRSLQ